MRAKSAAPPVNQYVNRRQDKRRRFEADPWKAFIDGRDVRRYSAKSMTVNLTQADLETPRNLKGLPGSRAVLLARLTIFIERLSPILIAAGWPIAVIIAASLFDLWSATPRLAHWLALVAAFALSGRLAYRHRRPDLIPARGPALARLEKDGGVRHDALRALEDAPLAGGGPLWDAHIADMRLKARAARLSAPRMTSNRIDPFGIRYAAVALIAIAVINAGGDAGSRLLAGFVPADPRAGAAGYADLWIEPPAYTGKAPIYLLRGSDTLPGHRKEIDAPEGSIVHAQVNAAGEARLSMRVRGKATKGEREGGDKSSRLAVTLDDSGMLTLRAGGRAGRWPINVIDDRAPTVDFIETPAADSDGRLAVAVKIDDDYGAVAAALRLRLDPGQERPLDAPAFDASATAESRLVDIDGAGGAAGARAFTLDLEAEPWAGLKTIASLVVTDAAGQTGETPPARITLPAKPFFNPLARAVVEQRQSLAVAPTEWRRAEWALNGLTLGPEYFFDNTSDYLLMRTAMWRVSKEAGGDYKAAVDDFWPLALQLEDEALELARRRLDAAKEALKNALENGAADSEIERLTEEMRAALQQYLQALAQSGGDPSGSDAPADEIVNSADIDAMLDSIRDLAKSGAGEAARQALADLENLLNNLRMPNRGAQNRDGTGGEGSAGDGGDGGATGQAGDLIGRQRELADKSFERGQKRGSTGDDLGQEQGAIAGDLSELMKSLEGADPEGAASRALGKALGHMRRSEEALRGEEFDSANEAMERAIASLREGAESLARAQGAGARARAGKQGGGDGGSPMRDPLGRPIGNAYGQGVDVPEKSDAQKTRELLQELRRRLSEGGRTQDEIDYLERLLERY